MGKGSRNKGKRRDSMSAKDYYRTCSDAGVHKANLADDIKSSGDKADVVKSGIDEKKLLKLFSTVATYVWRIKNQILDTETKDPKESIDDRGVAKLARYIASLDGALEDVGVQVVSDYDGKPHDEGDAVKVISYEDRADLKRDEYIETLLPTVRWTNEQGQIKLLQQAEVVVGRPIETNE